MPGSGIYATRNNHKKEGPSLSRSTESEQRNPHEASSACTCSPHVHHVSLHVTKIVTTSVKAHTHGREVVQRRPIRTSPPVCPKSPPAQTRPIKCKPSQLQGDRRRRATRTHTHRDPRTPRPTTSTLTHLRSLALTVTYKQHRRANQGATKDATKDTNKDDRATSPTHSRNQTTH